MILSPLLSINLQSQLWSWVKQTRNLRPIIKIGKEKFQLFIDVHQFTKDELRIKARSEFVIIEGKQEKKTKKGCVVRTFVRKFKLPDGCHPEKIKSQLSPNGCLTITALRNTCSVNYPCETLIPISSASKEPETLNEEKPPKESSEPSNTKCS